jgi:hypothetical protein
MVDDSLWNSFKVVLSEGMQREKQKAYTVDYSANDGFPINKIIKLVLNTAIEERAVGYMYQNHGKDLLPNTRDLMEKVFHEIARLSNNQSVRRLAIHHRFDLNVNPPLYDLWLKDFDASLKQRLLKQFSRKFTEEELSFFAESYVEYWMIHDKRRYDYVIADTIKKYQDAISYEEAKEKVYQSEVVRYKEKILTSKPSPEYLIIASQLKMKEIIPYLEEYANNENYDNFFRQYAVYGLTILKVRGYKQTAIKYFDTDEYKGDADIAEIINDQDIWYTYLRRLKSEKYIGKCPVAYRTIGDLSKVLKFLRPASFKKKWIFDYKWVVSIPECGASEEKIPIDKKEIKVVTDWMEETKGKYKLQHEIDKTF